MSSNNQKPITKEELESTGLEGQELEDYIARRKGIKPMPPKTTDNLSGDTSNQEPLDMEIMKKERPYYPYTHSQEECPNCKVLANLKIQEDKGWKLICTNKEGERIVLLDKGDTCEYCGRQLNRTKTGWDFNQ